MAINARKTTSQSLLDMKQESLGRMLVRAADLHREGKLQKLPSSTSRVQRRAAPLRVKVAEA